MEDNLIEIDEAELDDLDLAPIVIDDIDDMELWDINESDLYDDIEDEDEEVC